MNDYELYHASTRKHKYIKKIGNRYFYSQDELRTYLQGKRSTSKDISNTSQTVKAVADAASIASNTAKATQSTTRNKKARTVISDYAKKSIKGLKKQITKGKKALNEVIHPTPTVEVIDRIDQRTGEHF